MLSTEHKVRQPHCKVVPTNDTKNLKRYFYDENVIIDNGDFKNRDFCVYDDQLP